MAYILHLETATEICSVALSKDGKLIDLRENKEGKSHAALLTVFIEELLKANHKRVSDLDAVSVSMGPGSYTGLRIGVSTAKGLCYGTEIPLIAIPTLQAMANGMINRSLSVNEPCQEYFLCPMIDARRLEVYTAVYDMHLEEISSTRAIIIEEKSFEAILEKQKIIFFGNGAAKCESILAHPNAIFITSFFPSAKDLILLAEKRFKMGTFENTAYFEPYYLKDFVTTIPKKKVIL